MWRHRHVDLGQQIAAHLDVNAQGDLDRVRAWMGRRPVTNGDNASHLLLQPNTPVNASGGDGAEAMSSRQINRYQDP
jgi:hypothetical protein